MMSSELIPATGLDTLMVVADGAGALLVAVALAVIAVAVGCSCGTSGVAVASLFPPEQATEINAIAVIAPTAMVVFIFEK
jgi:hypothetical protein